MFDCLFHFYENIESREIRKPDNCEDLDGDILVRALHQADTPFD